MPWIFRLAAICGCLAAPCVADDILRAGTSEVEITPPIPYRMSGYFSERVSTGIQDPLTAKAIVWQQGETRAALVCCDLIGISPHVAQLARQQARDQLGIPAEHIAITATHSHTGPLYFGALREFLHDRSVQRLGSDPYEQVDYSAQLVERLVESIRRAQAVLRPVELRAGYALEDRLSFNRRFHMRDGSVRFNPGQQHPDIVRAAGPIDPQVGMIALHAPGADLPFAAIIAFALHLDTVGGTLYSADYPYWLQQQLRETYGDNFLSLFGAGTCGDINHIDVRIQGRRSTEEIGRLLGTSIVLQAERMTPVAAPSLAVRRAAVDVPLQTYPDEQFAAARRNMTKVDSPELSFLERVEAYKIMDLQLLGGTQLPLEVQAFRLGSDLAIVTLPGEVFVELGLAIKAASPFKTTLVIELANDAPGYLPTKRAFAEGSYETVNSLIAPGGAETMVETAVRLLRELSGA